MDLQNCLEIPKNHRTYLSITMQVLEDTILEVERILTNNPSCTKIMTETLNDISHCETTLILQHMAEIKKLISHIAIKLKLEKQLRKTRNAILGSMTVQRINLEEIKSKKLSGYGSMPDQLKEYLDPQVDRIINLIEEICKILRSEKVKEFKGK
ncbi:hypothetical protein HRbin37_02099 [bacterium HR37]|nr:hypothetical protein HRbin37_02099 [bacterium HR37]